MADNQVPEIKSVEIYDDAAVLSWWLLKTSPSPWIRVMWKGSQATGDSVCFLRLCLKHVPPLNNIPLFANPYTFRQRQAFQKLTWILKNTAANACAHTKKASTAIEWVVNCQLEDDIVLQDLYTFKDLGGGGGGVEWVSSVEALPVSQKPPGKMLCLQ